MTQSPLIETFYRLMAGPHSGAIESLLGCGESGLILGGLRQMSANTEKPNSIRSRARCAHITRKGPASAHLAALSAAIERHLGEELSDQPAARIAEGCGNWFRD
jgi:hypothetical protein